MRTKIRPFRKEDGSALDEVAKEAFAEYSRHFENWPQYHEEWSRMSELDNVGRIVVAECDDGIVGGVCYIGPGTPKPPWFKSEWAIIRSLVVDPRHRTHGIGKRLIEECLSLAEHDQCETVALQSTPIMRNAVAMYQDMGFRQMKTIGTKDGVTWYLYYLDMHNKSLHRTP